jgi:hypothetical protein
MTARHIVVVGSGSLARSLCYSLADLGARVTGAGAEPARVTVLARGGAAGEIAQVCRLRGAVSGGRFSFAAEPLRFEPAALDRLRADVLVCCASTQSPYERLTAPSAWTSIMQRAGFGVTLPLQTAIVVRLARAFARLDRQPLLLNGCFPDAVNPLLHALGLPVLCGIGNVATVAAVLQAALDLPDQRDLAVLGHHVHLAPPEEPDDEVRAWRDGSPVRGVAGLLAAARGLPRRELNAVAGHAAARLLTDVIDGTEVRTSLPGPLGLPGGYPVRLRGGTLSLNLPAGVTRAEATAWNLRVGRHDGVRVGDGRVTHTPSVAAALAPHLPDMADGWPVSALDEVSERLTALRQRLRTAPPVPAEPAPLA